MKFTRLTIPALSLAATTLLVAQGQPEPFPTPAPPTTPVPPAPGIPAVPAPVPPVPVPLPPVTPPPVAVPVPPVRAPAAVPPLAAPAAPAPAGGAAPVQPVSDPSIGVGLVNGTRVSARGRATIFSSLVFQFNKNEPVNILEEINVAAPKAGEPRKWFRVQVPADAGLWAHSDFLEAANILNGVDAAGKPVTLNVSTVRATSLNVRGGAGEQFPVLSKMPRGSQLVLTGASKGKWMEVLAPQNASVFVASQFVTRQQATVGVVEVPPVPAIPAVPSTPVVPSPVTPTSPKPTGQNIPAVTLPIQELGQGNSQTPGGVEVKQNPSITNPKPVQPAEVAVTPKPEVATPAKPEVPTPAKPVQIAKVNPNLPAPTLTKPKNDKPVRIVTREGIVRRTLDIQSPTGYVLEHLDSGKKINYLVLDEQVALKLNWFVGKQVLVSGEEALDARNANTPVLLVNTLKGELTQEFISKIAAARKEAVEKAQQEAEEAKRKAEEKDSKPEESSPEQSGEDKPEAN